MINENLAIHVLSLHLQCDSCPPTSWKLKDASFWGPHHVEALLVLLVRQHVTELLQFSTSSFQFREAPAWLMRPVFGDEPTQQQSIGLYQICLLHATIFFAPFGFLAFGSFEGSRGSSFRVVYSVTFEHMWTLNWNRSYQAHTLNLL